MLNTQTAEKVMQKASEMGADFAEIFVEKDQRQNLNWSDSRLKDIEAGIDFGVGLRFFFDKNVVYGYSNSTDADTLMRLTEDLCTLYQRPKTMTPESFQTMLQGQSHQRVQKGLSQDLSKEEKVARFAELDRLMRKESQQITQVSLASIQRLQEIEIFNSYGRHVQDTRNYTRFVFGSIGADGDKKVQTRNGPGSMLGWEMIEALNFEELAKDNAIEIENMLKAAPCPAGKMPVVLAGGFGGVIFHEACGHLLETTSVAKKASVFHDKMGEMIANEAVSAVDDGTIGNEWGSIDFDDEGLPTQKTQLIKNGKLTQFLADQMGAKKADVPVTGSGRRQNYTFAPTSRMRNTYIEAGPHDPDAIVASVEKGIFCAKLGGGSVSPGTGEFNFNAPYCFLIENGKVTKPLRAATLIGTGPEVLKNISMVGNDLSMDAGMCGSSSGAVPVTVGQPTLKVDDILVGGQA